jgi:small subunit ribosomal protein S20
VPNTASAAKRVRQTAKLRAQNIRRKRLIKERIKGVVAAVQKHDAAAAEAEFSKACSALDRIAAKGTIHKNAAARRKSRLAKQIKALKAQRGS